MSQIIRQREVTEIEREQKVDEHKSNVVDNSTHNTTDKNAAHHKTGVLGKIAEVFSTGWMHTEVTGHPYDTRGLYGPTGVKYTPAPGDKLADGTKVKQLDDHSMPLNGLSGAAPVGYTPQGIDQYTTHGSASNLNNNINTHHTGAALGAGALGAGAIAHKERVVEKERIVESRPVVASTPVVATTTTTVTRSKYLPVGANGFFAGESFRNELLRHGSRNRMSMIQKLEDSLYTRRRSHLRDWYMAERAEMQQSRLGQERVLEQQRIAEPLQTQSQGEIRVVQLPRTMVTSTFETNNSLHQHGFAELATQRAPLNIIETHAAPIIDTNATVVESKQRETIVSGPTFVSTSAMPIQEHMLSNQMAATSIGSSSLHHHNSSILSSNNNNMLASNTMATSGQPIIAREQAFEPQLAGRNNLAGNNMIVGGTPAGPAGAPYKTGVDSQYVDPNVRSTGEMSKDVTGFPYDTRGIAGPRGINADLAAAEKDMSKTRRAL